MSDPVKDELARAFDFYTDSSGARVPRNRTVTITDGFACEVIYGYEEEYRSEWEAKLVKSVENEDGELVNTYEIV